MQWHLRVNFFQQTRRTEIKNFTSSWRKKEDQFKYVIFIAGLIARLLSKLQQDKVHALMTECQRIINFTTYSPQFQIRLQRSSKGKSSQRHKGKFLLLYVGRAVSGTTRASVCSRNINVNYITSKDKRKFFSHSGVKTANQIKKKTNFKFSSGKIHEKPAPVKLKFCAFNFHSWLPISKKIYYCFC